MLCLAFHSTAFMWTKRLGANSSFTNRARIPSTGIAESLGINIGFNQWLWRDFPDHS